MLDKITKRIFGTANQRLLKGMERTLQTINDLESDIERLTNDQVMARTDEFRDRLGNGSPYDGAH